MCRILAGARPSNPGSDSGLYTIGGGRIFDSGSAEYHIEAKQQIWSSHLLVENELMPTRTSICSVLRHRPLS